MVIKICKTDWGNEYGTRPAYDHGKNFDTKHKNDVNEKNMISHDIANNALINEARVWVQKCIYNKNNSNTNGYAPAAMGNHEKVEYSDCKTKNEVPQIILKRKAAECFLNDWVHENSPVIEMMDGNSPEWDFSLMPKVSGRTKAGHPYRQKEAEAVQPAFGLSA
jgi:hypothetical protein